LDKVNGALSKTLDVLELGAMEIAVEHWSDLDVGKGMGSSTADIVASARALASACARELTPVQLAEIATFIESSDGTMYPGIHAVNHKTGELVREWDWWPQFEIVLIVPPNRLNTESVSFAGKERLAGHYESLLAGFDEAVRERDIEAFARHATMSAEMNQQFVPNPYFIQIATQTAKYGALGANVAHTGTCCGLLFPADNDGMLAASRALMDLQAQFPANVNVELTTTPASPGQ
jgi:L-threonine kinase